MQFPTTFTILALLAPLITAAPLAATVRVQLNGLSELAIQRSVPIDNTITAISGKFTDGLIRDLGGNSGVTCQAYSDAAATKKVGGRFGTNTVVFNGGKEVTIAAVKCKK